MSSKLPWPERVNTFQVNPESATPADVAKMAMQLNDITLKLRDGKYYEAGKLAEEYEEKPQAQ